MAIPIRNSSPDRMVSPSRTFFITSSTLGKRALFQSTLLAELFVKVLFEYWQQGKFQLHAFVLMPNHFHALVTVGPEMSIERAVQLIKGGFSFRAGRELDMRGIVWQRGFSEIRVIDEFSYQRQSNYIEMNPVRAHLVDCPQNYRFSSANHEYSLDPMPQGLKPAA